jgi:hypothetical protein
VYKEEMLLELLQLLELREELPKQTALELELT